MILDDTFLYMHNTKGSNMETPEYILLKNLITSLNSSQVHQTGKPMRIEHSFGIGTETIIIEAKRFLQKNPIKNESLYDNLRKVK